MRLFCRGFFLINGIKQCHPKCFIRHKLCFPNKYIAFLSYAIEILQIKRFLNNVGKLKKQSGDRRMKQGGLIWEECIIERGAEWYLGVISTYSKTDESFWSPQMRISAIDLSVSTSKLLLLSVTVLFLVRMKCKYLQRKSIEREIILDLRS